MSLPEPHEFLQLDVVSRGELINSYIGDITLKNEPSNPDLIDSFKRSYVIDQYVKHHHEQRMESLGDKHLNKSKWEAYLKSEFDNINNAFKPPILSSIKDNVAHMESRTNPKSLLEVVGANELAIAQKHNRSITERMGHMFEKYAAVSPFVFSPEDHYGIKAAGVDLIVLQNNDIIYCQMKTNKNTLTGSQDGRSKEELLLYNKAWFISAINSSVSWTFKAHDKIERKAGKEFWPLISIPYELVMESVKTLILEIENFIYS